MGSVSCVRDLAAVDCVITGPRPLPPDGSTELLVAYYSSDGGATWSEAAVPRQTFSEYSGSVSCAPTPAAVDCAETGMDLPPLYSRDGGATWSTSSGTATTGVSCTSTGKSADCTDGTDFSTDGGERWSPAQVPPDLSPYGAVCARTGSGVLCDANDQDSSVGIDYSANGGKSWSVPRMPPGYTYVGDSYLGNDWVACSASFTCATTAHGPPHGPSRATDYVLTTAKRPPPQRRSSERGSL
jgi:hypothetical protein